MMEAIERALDVALIVIENGGSTANAERTFRNVLKGYKQDGCAVGWRLDLVTVSGAGDDRAATVVRAIGPVGVSLVRASAAADRPLSAPRLSASRPFRLLTAAGR
jgi:hypothetical protein